LSGDFLSGLIAFIANLKLEINLVIEANAKKGNKEMKVKKLHLKCSWNGAKSLGVKAKDH
jgi:hypothetical protein